MDPPGGAPQLNTEGTAAPAGDGRSIPALRRASAVAANRPYRLRARLVLEAEDEGAGGQGAPGPPSKPVELSVQLNPGDESELRALLQGLAALSDPAKAEWELSPAAVKTAIQDRLGERTRADWTEGMAVSRQRPSRAIRVLNLCLIALCLAISARLLQQNWPMLTRSAALLGGAAPAKPTAAAATQERVPERKSAGPLSVTVNEPRDESAEANGAEASFVPAAAPKPATASETRAGSEPESASVKVAPEAAQGAGEQTGAAPSAAASAAPPEAPLAIASAPKPGAAVVSAESQLPDAVIAVLLARGDAFLRSGDIAAARLSYERAAVAGSAVAAEACGRTYDPAVLKELGVRGAAGDAAKAAAWYRRALALGDAAAAELLASLR